MPVALTALSVARVVGIVGWSGAGKTTLLAKIIPLLVARGLRVATVKRAHHGFDVDTPGKDSHTHRAAGATEVLVASAKRWALMHENPVPQEPDLADLLERLSPADLVLVEGFKSAALPKIEVHRAANGKPFLFPHDTNIAALLHDGAPPEGAPQRAYLDDRLAACAFVLAAAEPLADVLQRLRHEAASPA